MDGCTFYMEGWMKGLMVVEQNKHVRIYACMYTILCEITGSMYALQPGARSIRSTLHLPILHLGLHIGIMRGISHKNLTT